MDIMIDSFLKKIKYVLLLMLSLTPILANANVDDLNSSFQNDAWLPTFNVWKWFIKTESPYYFALVITKQIIMYTGIIAVIAVMIWWITYLVSLWNDEKIKKAKNIIIYSIVWVLVSILSYTFVDIINSLTLN